ncbi:protocatechuate 3,4-dioxygenase [Leptothrix discophora]|uniref:Protocatechuate 3,4-dioxygenase n=1 Tax=Leptothrix discophora TaxID=89 RepID=A0ABT9G7E9_LEPDI|nr:protocatechuate 3,4-dioxygenase [Leptothrix discophora]MDP4302407.1 protocatechuate 3,4-dioxygenase [Leptothrix discophora]
MPALWLPARGQDGAPLRPTVSQAEGPFYPVRLPADGDADLLRNGTRMPRRGQPAQLEGRLVDLRGRPLAGLQVEIWQCDADGHYHHPGDGDQADPGFQGWGRASVDGEGRWRFRTIRPAPYTGRTPHIHVKVKDGRRELLTTQLYVAGEPGNERDGLYRSIRDPRDRAALTVAFEPGPQGLVGQARLVLDT